MTAVEAWCDVTGNDCYPTPTELRWLAFTLITTSILIGLHAAWRAR